MTTSVKSTVNISRYNKEQLEKLVELRELDSVTEGINLAIEIFVKNKQKELYARQMRAAAEDSDFMQRTLGTQQAFEDADNDLDRSLTAEDSEW